MSPPRKAEGTTELTDEEYADLERTYRKAEDQLAQQDLHHKELHHVQRPPSPRPM
jgi:hypothetical protein